MDRHAPVSYTHLFDEVLLSDIIKELERSYDVKITVADDTLNTIPVSYTHLDVYKRQLRFGEFASPVGNMDTFLE